MKCEYANAVHKIIELAKVIENRKNAMWVNGVLDKRVKGRLLTIGKILNQDVDTGDKNCNLQNVSGMFSSDKLEQAYKDGVRDALAKGYGTFDEENYR